MNRNPLNKVSLDTDNLVTRRIFAFDSNNQPLSNNHILAVSNSEARWVDTLRNIETYGVGYLPDVFADICGEIRAVSNYFQSNIDVGLTSAGFVPFQGVYTPFSNSVVRDISDISGRIQTMSNIFRSDINVLGSTISAGSISRTEYNSNNTSLNNRITVLSNSVPSNSQFADLSGRLVLVSNYFQTSATDLSNRKVELTVFNALSNRVNSLSNNINAISNYSFETRLQLSNTRTDVSNTIIGFNNTLISYNQRINDISNAVTNFTLGQNVVSCNAFNNLKLVVDDIQTRTTLSKVRIGDNAGQINQGGNSVAVGSSAGNLNQEPQTVSVGLNAGRDTQKANSVAIGAYAGEVNQQSNSVAIGIGAGQNFQRESSISIGFTAGSSSQQKNSIAIGNEAGYQIQSENAIAIGNKAGCNNQQQNSIAIGLNTGRLVQGSNSIAIGVNAGETQGNNCIALGDGAGTLAQSNQSIAIGYLAGYNNVHSNSIIINATGEALNTSLANAFYVKPISILLNSQALFYDASTGEITHATRGPTLTEASNLASNIASNVAPVIVSNVAPEIVSNVAPLIVSNVAPAIASNAASNVINARLNTDRIKIGNNAGQTNQGLFTVAVGDAAGANWQQYAAVAIGSDAGNTSQQTNAVAIGNQAGMTNQGSNSIAIGNAAGKNSQLQNSIILNATGTTVNANLSNAFYVKPIRNATNAQTLFYDTTTGEITYAVQTVASNQGVTSSEASNIASNSASNVVNSRLNTSTVQIGTNAGSSPQGLSSVAIGNNAAATTQGNYSVAIGNEAGKTSQFNASVAVGANAGTTSQQASSIAIGPASGETNQGTKSISIGASAGNAYQGSNSVAIGNEAGKTSQKQFAVAIGSFSGNVNQASHAVAIGNNAGNLEQSGNTVAIGSDAGRTSQKEFAVALGAESGYFNQFNQAIAIGKSAGFSGQKQWAIAIGAEAGGTNQGEASIAIGRLAGNSEQHANSIILNATANSLTSSNPNAFYVKPVRNRGTCNIMNYDVTSGEVSYNNKLKFISDVATSDDLFEITSISGSRTSSFIWGGIEQSDSNAYNFFIGGNAANGSEVRGGLRFTRDQNSTVNYIQSFSSRTDGSSAQLHFTRYKSTVASSGVVFDMGAGRYGFNTESLTHTVTINGTLFVNSPNITLGTQAGSVGQSNSAIAIGNQAGQSNQGPNSIAIGLGAGRLVQGTNCIGIGVNSGRNQSSGAIAIGDSAGFSASHAAPILQGAHSIAIGTNAGYDTMCNNSIVISALGTPNLNATRQNSLYIAPIRSNAPTSADLPLLYNNTSKEITRADESPIIMFAMQIQQDVLTNINNGTETLSNSKWGAVFINGFNFTSGADGGGARDGTQYYTRVSNGTWQAYYNLTPTGAGNTTSIHIIAIRRGFASVINSSNFIGGSFTDP